MRTPGDMDAWMSELRANFTVDTLRAGNSVLASVLGDRGILGKYYINSSDFPSCFSSKEATDFVKKYASGAIFVKAKTACSNCPNHRGDKCRSFGKTLVETVPYTGSPVDDIISRQATLGYVDPPLKLPPKDRLRLACTEKKKADVGFSGVANPNASSAIIPVSRLTKSSVDQMSLDASPVIATIRKSLLAGKTQDDVSRELKSKYSAELLQRTANYWGPEYREAGLYGKLYVTQDSFDTCREGAEFVKKHSSAVRVVVAGSKCSSCLFRGLGSCSVYDRPLVASLASIYNDAFVSKLRTDVTNRGADRTAAAQDLGDIKATLRHLCGLKATTNQRRVATEVSLGNSAEKSKRAGVLPKVQSGIVTATRDLLNQGLHGRKFVAALTRQYTASDVRAAFPMIKHYLTEQGIQGSYYVDPSVYPDYGVTCATLKSKFLSSPVEFVLAGPKCATCVHRSTLDASCSVLQKPLIADVPAEIRERLRSQFSEPQPAPVKPREQDFAEEYEVKPNLTLEIEPEAEGFSIQLGNALLELKK
jgi:hypothetical protein